MKRWQPLLLVVAAMLLTGSGLVLIKTGSDRRAALTETHARLTELRMRRLAPYDSEEMKRALKAGPNPQSGLLVASESEAASRLEILIRSVARDNGAEIQSISFSANSTGHTTPTVSGSLYLSVNHESIEAFVKALEAGPPAVFLENLRIAHRPSDQDTEVPLVDLNASILVYRDTPADEKSLP